MKKILGLAMLLFIALSACKKKKESALFGETINGVNLRSDNGSDFGTLGSPDVYIKDATFSLNMWPKPTQNISYCLINNNSSTAINFTIKIFTAYFNNMPQSIPPQIGQGSIPIENANLGTGAIKEYSYTLGANAGSNMSFDFSNLPRGFYKFVVTLDNGKKYWDNIWVYRP